MQQTLLICPLACVLAAFVLRRAARELEVNALTPPSP